MSARPKGPGVNAALIFVFSAQTAAMFFDEFYFHRRRGLPFWERIGHPVDTVFLLLALIWIKTHSYSLPALRIYILLGLISSLLITKDEWIHLKHCEPLEQWLHSILFMCHPLILVLWGWHWVHSETPASQFLGWQISLIFTFLVYQIYYWNIRPVRMPRAQPRP